MPSVSSARVMLVPETRPTATTGPQAAKIRRYRLARLRLLERRDEVEPRYAHLRRAHD